MNRPARQRLQQTAALYGPMFTPLVDAMLAAFDEMADTLQTTTDSPPDEIYRSAQAAQYLGLGLSTFRALVARGEIPTEVYAGKKQRSIYRFRKSALDRFLARSERAF